MLLRSCVFVLALSGVTTGVRVEAVENPGRFWLYAGVRSAREHAASLRRFTGYEVDPGECGDVMMGPLVDGHYTGEEAWRRLVGSVCNLVEQLDIPSGKSEVFADMSNCKCSFGFPPLQSVSNDRLDLGTTTVTGNTALPKVLFVVPWKKSEIGEAPAEPYSPLLDEAFTPLDREEFRREVTYYEALSGSVASQEPKEVRPLKVAPDESG